MIGWLDDNLITMVNGLALGVLLFTIASGLSLIFGVIDVLNLSHGAIYVGGAYLAVTLVSGSGGSLLGLLLAVLAAVVLGGAAGAGLAVATRPLVRRGHLDQALLTIGIAFVLVELYTEIYGSDVQSVAPPDALAGSVLIAGDPYPVYRLVVAGAGLALAAVAWYVIERTHVGALIRATVADAPMVRALGVDTRALLIGVFAAGTAMAAVGGVLGAPILSAAPGLDVRVLILALVVVVIGGLGSVLGALVGALLIGQVETLGVSLLPDFAPFLTFAAMAVVLVARPTGILGTGRAA